MLFAPEVVAGAVATLTAKTRAIAPGGGDKPRFNTQRAEPGFIAALRSGD
jgi:hypothetical protein